VIEIYGYWLTHHAVKNIHYNRKCKLPLRTSTTIKQLHGYKNLQ
jgi:hypothetical protein